MYKKAKKNKKCKDHKGIEYKNERAMCRAYGTYYDTYIRRISRGMTKEEALTTRIERKQWNEECEDHLGNKFTSIRKMCKYHDISYQTYLRRRDNGLSVEESLKLNKEDKTVTDHLGNTYSNFKLMCNAYGRGYDTVKKRLADGWNLEDALTQSPTQIIDHLNKVYKSENQMCKAYGINRTTFRQRLNKGWDLEKSLTHPVERKK